MAGALIDVSLWEAPAGMPRRLDRLSPEERALYRGHPERSAALLSGWDAPASLVETVLQHHEREQGQGFPRQVSGGAIGQDAKIIGLVDTYASRSAPLAMGPGLRPHEAIREIVRSKQDTFPPALVKVLLSEISVFPPGTLVRLNTGEVGQVVAVNRNHPLRPRIAVVADGKGQPPAVPKTIDLAETPFLYINGPAPASS
jgi:HD-GYP domain-containing protein (c-di-GMP phosphodiesterase class II)